MTNMKKISSTLSIAATILLEACSSGGDSGGNSAPAPEINTTAPQLIGSWTTDCTITTQGTSTTTTGASGSGGGSVTGGESFLANASFTQAGQIQLNAEFFASTNCNANKSNGFSSFEGIYFIGETGTANDGSNVTNIDISDTSSTTYTIFQIVNGFSLFIGNKSESSSGKDGNKSSSRFDGLSTARYIKQ